MINKYLTKIALVYPQLQKTEFDMAFDGEGNPTKQRIIEVAHRKDYDQYQRNLNSWKSEAEYAENLRSHIADMPTGPTYGDYLDELEGEHGILADMSGKAVPGPSKVGLGVGYGLGAAGLGAGALLKNPGLALTGLAAAGITGIYHNLAQPEKRYNRYLGRVENLNQQKNDLLSLAQQDGI
jgi:hypothetical protein